MADWKRTSCVLCYHNCGLEVQTEGNKILKVRADKNHPRTRGYMCRKGTRIAFLPGPQRETDSPFKEGRERLQEDFMDQAITRSQAN